MSRATDIEKAQCCSDGFLHRFCLNKPCDGLKTRQAGTAKHLVDLDKAAQGYAIVIRNMALQVCRVTLRAHDTRPPACIGAHAEALAQHVVVARSPSASEPLTPHLSPLSPSPEP